MPTSYTLPQYGYPSGTISWDDGTTFNGYVLIGLKTMASGGTTWTSAALKSGRTIPVYTQIPILNGQFQSPPSGVLYNSEIVPPGTQYVASYYDVNNVLVSTVTSAFEVTGQTFTIPAVTITAPTPSANPTPQT